jgi:hypothetical protein
MSIDERDSDLEHPRTETSDGAAALAHGNRGRKPVQTISEEVRHQVIQLAATTYTGCNYQEEEDAAGYFWLIQQMLEQHGRPVALYHDRQGIFAQTSKATETETLEEQLAGKQDPTQFGRLLEELEITSIAARSPQAKGRVERLFGPYKSGW